MLTEIITKMEQQNIRFKDKNFYDWIKNELDLMSGNKKKILEGEILKTEMFRTWYKGNFYTFKYNFQSKPTSPYIPSYDKEPFIYLLKREKGILHGFNMNYLSPVFAREFMEDIYEFYPGPFEEEQTTNISKIMATYENIERYDKLLVSKAIYRKYNLKYINNINVVPKVYAKIFVSMSNGLFPLSSRVKVYIGTAKKTAKLRSKKNL